MPKKRHLQPQKKPPQKVRTAMTVEEAGKTPAGQEARGIQHTEAQKRANDARQRGAGAGERATLERSKGSRTEKLATVTYPNGKTAKDYSPENYDAQSGIDEPDPAAGKLDYVAIAAGELPRVMNIRDRRAYLVSQAAKNEAYNDREYAKQAEAAEGVPALFAEALIPLEDPDVQRDMAEEQAESAENLSIHTVEGVKKWQQSRQRNN